jgi:hypothetical protein
MALLIAQILHPVLSIIVGAFKSTQLGPPQSSGMGGGDDNTQFGPLEGTGLDHWPID